MTSLNRRAVVALAGTLAALAAAPAAQAATVSYDGTTLVLTAKPGERNSIIVGRSDLYTDTIKIGDNPAIDHPGGASCVDGGNGWLHCAAPAAVRVLLADGDDDFSFASDEALYGPVTVDGGAGNDTLRGTNVAAGAVTMAGGAGNDTLEGKAANETLLGGDGNDKLSGRGGGDVLRGEGGDDVLDGDVYETPAADVLDGGAGADMVQGWTVDSSSGQPQISVTLDGAANDGRPGEGDDVRDVERITSHMSGTIRFGDADDFVDMWANLDEGRSTISTAGGNDRIVGGNAEETVDAGPGDDRVEAGFGNDSIVPGPGRDTVFADKTGGNCGLFESCDVPVGNDVVDARDGEVDSVDCGVGTDRALVDAIDVVSNCETVERAAAPAPPASQGSGRPGAKTAGARLVLSTKTLRAASLRRKGLTFRVTGARPGRATFTATIRGRRVGTRTVKVGRKGTAAVRIRISRRARSLVRRGAKLTIRGAGARLTVQLR